MSEDIEHNRLKMENEDYSKGCLRQQEHKKRELEDKDIENTRLVP